MDSRYPSQHGQYPSSFAVRIYRFRVPGHPEKYEEDQGKKLGAWLLRGAFDRVRKISR